MSDHKCLTCKHAVWRLTKVGRLHPDGDGKCTYVVPVFPVPASMWWGMSGREQPRLSGGSIHRRPTLPYTACPTWEPK